MEKLTSNMKEYQRNWRNKNRDKLKSKKAAYHIENKEQINAYHRKKHEENKEKENLRRRKYYQKNKEKCLKHIKVYSLNNKEHLKLKQKEYYIKNKEKIVTRCTKYQNKKYKTDKSYRISQLLRGRIASALRSTNTRKFNKSMQLLGCSLEEFKNHLESQFKGEMNWNNQGYYGWHIDHIIPCSSFNLTKKEDQKKCFHYTNLQPLWWTENLQKSDNL
jgi:hypothetical protein